MAMEAMFENIIVNYKCVKQYIKKNSYPRMNILVINPILYTCEGWNIPRVKSIKDTMIYNMCRGFKSFGHKVTLCASKEFMPSDDEEYEFDVVWHRSSMKRLLPPPIPFSWELWRI